MVCGASDVACKGAGARNRAVQPDNNVDNLEKGPKRGNRATKAKGVKVNIRNAILNTL